MKNYLRHKNIFVLFGLGIFVSACAPMQNFLHPQNISVNNKDIDIQRQGLLGPDSRALGAKGLNKAIKAEYQALEYKKVGEIVEWHDAKNNAYGRVKAGQPYRVGSQNCRQYSHEWKINGVPNTARGSACRNEDGSWTPLI